MINLNGNYISTDSYDSADPNYSTNGLYDSAKRKAYGDVVSDGLALDIGGAKVRGHVRTAPGGTVSFQSHAASVGDLAWVDADTLGIEPGWATDDLNFIFDDVVLPNVSWSLAFGAGTGGPGKAPDGITYAHVFTSVNDTWVDPGNYTVTDDGDVYVGTNVTVRLNITASSFSPTNIFVAGVATNEAGKLTAYLNGSGSVTLNSNVRPQSGRPSNLMFFGLPGCTNIAFTGNGDFAGTIYAPEADFSLNGNTNATHDFCGSIVTKTISMNGHCNFHFDEDLKRTGPFR